VADELSAAGRWEPTSRSSPLGRAAHADRHRLLLSFVGRSLRTPAAILGGIGFGLFIDEGKFVTADNDYFFKTSAAIIYVVFVVLFLIGRAIQRRRGLEPREYLVNALDPLTEAARGNLDDQERRRALELLRQADADEPLVGRVRQLLEETETVPVQRRLLARSANGCEWCTTNSWSVRDFAGAQLVLHRMGAALIDQSDRVGSRSVAQVLWGYRRRVDVRRWSRRAAASQCRKPASSLVASALVIYDVWRLRRGSRLDAYRMFERALLVQIFVGQFFSFVESQFAAVLGLAIDILLLVTVRYLLRFEQQRVGPGRLAEARGSTPPTASPVVPGG